MANLFHVDIISPGKIIYKGDAVSLIVPAEFGYLGVLANHAPLIAHLAKGRIILRDGSNEPKFFDCEKGFMEVLENTATLIMQG